MRESHLYADTPLDSDPEKEVERYINMLDESEIDLEERIRRKSRRSSADTEAIDTTTSTMI